MKKDWEKNDEDKISDLHSIKEDEYDDEVDDEMNPHHFVHNKKEYADYVFQAVEKDTVVKMIKEHYAKIEKVKSFLKMCL